jgi:hypothetical protein
MIVVRDVFHAKYGRGGDLVAIFKEAQEKWPAEYATRILTDASGQFFTVVSETDVESLAAWEQTASQYLTLPEFADWFERMTPLIDSGSREFYNVET